MLRIEASTLTRLLGRLGALPLRAYAPSAKAENQMSVPDLPPAAVSVRLPTVRQRLSRDEIADLVDDLAADAARRCGAFDVMYSRRFTAGIDILVVGIPRDLVALALERATQRGYVSLEEMGDNEKAPQGPSRLPARS
jgi:hypothetical protein